MKYKMEWNLQLLYKGIHDPQIQKDLQKSKRAILAFEKKYRNKSFTTSALSLVKALRAYENLLETVDGKPYRYFNLLSDIHSDDKKVSARATALSQQYQILFNKIIFFELELAKIPLVLQKKYQKDKRLLAFRYYLEKIFEHARYNLSEREEQLSGLLSLPAESLWYDSQKEYFNTQTLTFKGKKIPLTKALEMVSQLPKKERRLLKMSINTLLQQISFFAEAEINAIYNFKKIMDERRGYKKPYSATALAYENAESEIETLTKTITNSFSISRRFYKLHAKLLKEKMLYSADINAPIGKMSVQFDIKKGIEIVKRAFSRFDPVYTAQVEKYFANGQVDVFPRKNKTGGGYHSSSGKQPNFILLNYVNDVRSVETLAHEFGHSIHSELSKPLSPLYRNYTISVAEVASTFFEQLLFDELTTILPEKEQVVLLHKKIQGDMGTIFRQVACFNCEHELHQLVRSRGKLSASEIATTMNKHMQDYLGESVKLKDMDGYIFVFWSHLRYFFYVYSYAYGQIVSRALYETWKQDHSYKEKIEHCFKAGSSCSPKDIFKQAGIDTTDPSFLQVGLQAIKDDIEKLEKLAKHGKRK